MRKTAHQLNKPGPLNVQSRFHWTSEGLSFSFRHGTILKLYDVGTESDFRFSLKAKRLRAHIELPPLVVTKDNAKEAFANDPGRLALLK